MSIGRNDLCSCGSGKKFKKCHGAPSVTTADADPIVARANALKQLDRTLDQTLLRFAGARGGVTWFREAIDAYNSYDPEPPDQAELQIAVPWAVYHFPSGSEGESMAELMLAKRGTRLAPELRELLAAQLDAWLSVWEVREVQPGVGLGLADLLTGELRFVYDVSATRHAVVRDALLGRVVTCNDVSFLGGLHPHVLAPREADAVVREMKQFCRVRTKPVAKAKLRNAHIQRALLDAWFMALFERDRPKAPPVMQNTDGELVMFTTDHFDFAEANRREVLARLARLPGIGEPEVTRGETTLTVTKPGNATHVSWDNTVVGSIVIKGTRLQAETNSMQRANALRTAIETHTGGLVTHRLRDESSPTQLVKRTTVGVKSGATMAMPPELKAVARQMKESHMQAWVDEPIPALGGLTPRKAAASPKSRRALELLLKEFEHFEAQLPADERFDMARVRLTLGMP